MSTYIFNNDLFLWEGIFFSLCHSIYLQKVARLAISVNLPRLILLMPQISCLSKTPLLSPFLANGRIRMRGEREKSCVVNFSVFVWGYAWSPVSQYSVDGGHRANLFPWDINVWLEWRRRMWTSEVWRHNGPDSRFSSKRQDGKD